MTDPVKGASDTGASSSAAPQGGFPAENESAAASQAPGAFGATRGSGLARGKRTASPAAPAASAKSGEYQPTTIEVIVPKLEYQNPFAAATEPVAAPAEVPHSGTKEGKEDSAQPKIVAPSAPAPIFRAPTPAPAPAAPVFEAPEPAPAPSSLEDEPASEPAAKPELKILPPAETKRTHVQWENPPPSQRSSGSSHSERAPREDRRDERGAYPPRQPRDPRDERPGFSPRQPRDPRDEPRRDDRPTFRTDAQRARETQRSAPAASTPVKSGGFFGWLKSLFAGKKPAPTEIPSRSHERPEGEFPRDGEHPHRRRRRGGRGRHGGGGGGGGDRGHGGYPRHEGATGQGSAQEGEHSGGGHERSGEQPGGGEHQGGQRRSRHRGGRGRRRDDRGGGDRGGPRPEGQQGGGFI